MLYVALLHDGDHGHFDRAILTAIENSHWRYGGEQCAMSIASGPSCGGLKLTFWILQDDVQTLQDETGTMRVVLILLNVATAPTNHDC